MKDFDVEMDYLANKASFEQGHKGKFNDLISSDNELFSTSDFKMPSFS